MPLRRVPNVVPCAAAVLAAAGVLATRPLAAQDVDVVRGRVVGPERQPVEGARVTVTSVSGNVNRTARTDKNGRFTVTFPGGDGDYFVTYAALGYAPRRFEVKRVADEDFLVADATLQRAAAQLDSVQVRGQRGRVARGEANAPDVGGTERRVDPGLVAPDQMGDLAAMAAAQPGVTPVPGADGDPAGYSVLGLSPDQNQTTLNGLNFGGTNLPRDAAVTSSLVTSPYDVSAGGFSGSRFNLRTRPGTNYVARGASLFGTAPQLQWTDRAARALGQPQTSLSLGGSASGPIRYDQAFYNLSFQLGRQASDLRTLMNTDPVGLQAAGIAADSVRRLAALLAGQRVPVAVGALPTDRLSDQGALFGAFDLTPPSSNSGQSVNLTLNGNWNRQTPASSLLAEFPAHAGDRTSWTGGAQARHSSYVRNVLLSETTLGASRARSYGTPYLALPSGTVLVNSEFGDGTNGVRAIAFGGSPSLGTAQRTTTAGAMNQLSWFSTNNRHRLKLTSELRQDGFAQDQATNRLGSFAYNSLADLEAGRAAVFSRQLAPRQRRGGQTVAALSLGDSYKRTPRLQLQYGVRVDANRFSAGPAENPAVERVFGVPNDARPSRVYVSPRVGFSWGYGTAPQVAGFEGAARGPRAVVRGGAGLFQNTPQATLLGTAIDNTGLPSAAQQITCVGAAAPAADWGAYAADAAAIPTRCADGSAGSVFADASPNVTLFARDYRAPHSLRSNLSWGGPVLGNRLSANVEGTYSLNLAQPGFVDLNFRPGARFTLADEGGRPVFVQPSSVVPATGAIAWRDARVSPLFARVGEQRSDLRSESRQLRFGVSPTAFNPNFSWSLSYVFTSVREETRGFASTAGDPLARAWSRGAFDARHQLVYSLGYNVFDAVRVSWFGNMRSGLPFTPQVAADVNGDGYANDRAFVVDPGAPPSTRAADPALGAGVAALLANGSPAARACLRSQLGRLAGRNSCTGPWTQSANLRIAFNPLKVHMPQRATLSLAVSNPLGAVDRLLHGDAGLRGWGQVAAPDPQLLYVRGFDPAGPNGPRFRYEVNRRFGATSPQLSAFRAPVTLTAMLRVDVGPSRERQQLTQQLDRGRRREGQRAPEFLLKAMYAGGGLPNPMAQLLRQADTLRLTGPQADSLATMNRWYTIRLDSIWSPVAKYLADLPSDYRHDDAYDRYRDARRASVDLLVRLAPAVKDLLTPAQRRKLPPYVASALDPRYLAAVRSGTAGLGGGFTGGMLGGMLPAGAMPPGAMAGGGERVIIRGP